MRLDRNTEGRGKYAVLKLRRLHDARAGLPMEVLAAVQTLDDHGLIEWGESGTRGEFFNVSLKDVHAQPALIAYAGSAMLVDPEYARDVRELAARSGPGSRWCKDPD